MDKILIISNNKINDKLIKHLIDQKISFSKCDFENFNYNNEEYIMLFDENIDESIKFKNKKLILFIENDIMETSQTVDDQYNLFNKINKYDIIVSNKCLTDKLLFLFPLLSNKTIDYTNISNDYLNNKTIEINQKLNVELQKFKTTTCTVIKDEQQYLEEWINYNLNLGFDEIWLFEDDGSIPHNDICDKYPQVHLNKLSDIGVTTSKQINTWNYFISNYKEEFDWVAFIDIDEFIMFEEGWNLQKLLNEYKTEGGIYLFWQMFNASGHIDNPHTPILSTYTNKCDIINQDSERWHFKSLVNLKVEGQLFITNHECLYGVSTNGLKTRQYVCYEKAWINHYFSRSWEEWCDRFLKRGDITPYCRSYLHFYECNKDMIPYEDILLEKFEQYKIETNAKTLAIYYIATGDYTKYINDFIQNIHHFMPHLRKTVVILSDGLEEFNGKTYKGVNYIVKKIEHNHWPIVTLFKMTYILKNKIDCDYVCYLNGDALFNPIYHAYYMFDFEKINISQHFHYDNENMHWYLDSSKKFLVDNENKRSLAYIDNTNYTYVQGGFFFGKSDLIYSMCEDIDKMVKIDLKNNIIPVWHDESYLNKWVLLNNKIVNIKQFLQENTHKLFIPFTINSNKRHIKPKTQY